MAEAHSVGALSVTLTHDGISVSYDQELLAEIWYSFARAYKRRIARFKNDFISGIFPANFYTIASVVFSLSLFSVLHRDLSLGVVPFLWHNVLSYFFGDGILSHLLSLIICGVLFWFTIIQFIRLSLKLFLSYKGWLHESPKTVSLLSKLWLGTLHLMSRSGPMMQSFQGALPHLPLPNLNQTLERHLESMRPLCTDEEYTELIELSERFRSSVGPRLQRYLYLKSYFSINYISDWWEEFVYLRQRSPIMVNSNYYAMDTINGLPTCKQSARAANITCATLLFRRLVERQKITPFSFMPQYKIPFCTMQYERLFNSCRIPGVETDQLMHWHDAKHIAVYCNGCWYRVPVHTGKRLYTAPEMQKAFEMIIEMEPEQEDGEEHLAALTAGERLPWAKARKQYFSSGINKTSLDTIESAAFVMILDEQQMCYDPNDSSKLDQWACSLLHGDGSNRWFDKSFCFIIYRNGHLGMNVEHSWGDATIIAHLMEFCAVQDLYKYGYDDRGDTIGPIDAVPKTERLRWSIPAELDSVIMSSLATAKQLIDDVEMALLVWNEYGKGMMKKLMVSPDGFLQLTLQLAYFRNQQKFSLTYEATTARLYREGRTETVRSCTTESCDFVRAMLDPQQDWAERARLLRIACDHHQQLYRDAMSGKGIDRHLFALYIVSRYLEVDSPFLKKVFPPTFSLSTSQTPINQCADEKKRLGEHLKHRIMTGGGGFGPVADRGYGVSYMVLGEDCLLFHISSKKSADNTSSLKFRDDLITSLREMRQLLSDGSTATN